MAHIGISLLRFLSSTIFMRKVIYYPENNDQKSLCSLVNTTINRVIYLVHMHYYNYLFYRECVFYCLDLMEVYMSGRWHRICPPELQCHCCTAK